MTTELTITKADRGLAIHEALTVLRDAAVKAAKSSDEAIAFNELHRDALDHLVKVTGVRLSAPSILNSLTTDQEAVVLAQTAKRLQRFLTAKFSTMDWTATAMPPMTSLKNLVDHQVYEHLATVTQGNKTFYFCQSSKGRCVFSELKFWGPVIGKATR